MLLKTLDVIVYKIPGKYSVQKVIGLLIKKCYNY